MHGLLRKRTKKNDVDVRSSGPKGTTDDEDLQTFGGRRAERCRAVGVACSSSIARRIGRDGLEEGYFRQTKNDVLVERFARSDRRGLIADGSDGGAALHYFSTIPK